MLLSGQAALAADDSSRHFEIEAKPLADALMDFGVQSGLTVAAPTPLTAGKRSASVRGDLPPTAALRQLLERSGLTFARATDGTIVIQTASGSSGRVPMSAAESGFDGHSTMEGALETIVVTAEKRSERLLDTPIPVSVVNTEALTATNQLRLQDYYTAIPGLTMTTGPFGSEALAIRGISNEIGGSPTVGIVVDDAPFGGTAGGNIIPDIDPGDLARVEVLRGPQGTLYGTASMGGLIKYVTLDPSPEAFSARVQAGTSTVYNGPELGYNVRASANIPVNEQLAVRVSAFTRKDPGYIDDVQTAQRSLNALRVSGARLASLFRFSDDWSLRFSGYFSDSTTQGQNNDVLPSLGDLKTTIARGGEYNDTKIQNYSLAVDGKLGGADFKSITAYSSTRQQRTVDYSFVFGGLTLGEFGVAGAIVPVLATTDKVTQEFRLSNTLWQRLDWVLGAFYTHEYEGAVDTLVAENPVTGVTVPGSGSILLSENYPQKYVEYAGFADLTYHFTDRFNVQIGARESRSTIAGQQTDVGQVVNFVNPELDATANAFTYLVTPQFKISPDVMLYARLASGYRAGGFNAAASGAPFAAFQPTFAPDKTYNYEIGAKADLFDHRFSVDASVYYINWKDVQLNVFEYIQGVGYSFSTNAGGAKSEGIELAASVRPLPGLNISAWVDYGQEVLTQAFPPAATVLGSDGDRLPNSSRYSGNVSAQQDFPISNSVSGFIGATAAYLGNRLGAFQSTADRQYYPPYAKVDLRAGIKYELWNINLYGNNVTNRRGLISGGLDYFPPPNAAVYIQPRLIGLNVSRTF